jgi:FkbM family methyltransferase
MQCRGDGKVNTPQCARSTEFISFSENFEDVMLNRALKDLKDGFYIDVGAGDPTTNSVTAAFYASGWSGINIEPDPRRYALLAALRLRDTNLNVAAGREDADSITFYQMEHADLSTCDPSIASWHRESGMAIDERSVRLRSLSSICQQHAPEQIHFLKIDVEGFERDVLLGADFERYRPWIVVVEATTPLSKRTSHQMWEGILTSAGYAFSYFDGLNRFYVRSDLNDTFGQAFALPPNVFDYFVRAADAETVATFEAVRRTSELSARLAQSEILCRQLQMKLEEAEDHARAAHIWQHKAHLLDARMQALFASTSWRITAPLRRMVITVRKGLRYDRAILPLLRGKTLPSPRTAVDRDLPLTFDIIGHVNGSYSLAEGNRAIIRCLMVHSRAEVRLSPIEGGDSASIHTVEAAEKPLLEAAASTLSPEGSRRIAIVQHYPLYTPRGDFDLKTVHLPWEEGLMPGDMVDTINANYDAVLTPTTAAKKAITDSGVTLPVRVIGYPAMFAGFRAIARARTAAAVAGIKSEVVFLNVSSCFPRKGIDVLIDAYTDAFTADDRVRLIIKGFPNPHNNVASLIKNRNRLSTNAAPITFLNCDMSRDDLLALYRQADVVVLPTRGEGLNIPAAETLAAGLRLIVTGAGGHMDFVDAQSARLLDYSFSQSKSHLATLNSVWFEPSRPDLVKALRETFAEILTQRASGLIPDDRWPNVSAWFDEEAFSRRLEATTTALLSRPQERQARIAWVSTFNVKCGIAEYSRNLISSLSVDNITVLCDDRAPEGKTKEGHAIVPAWRIGESSANRLAHKVEKSGANIIVVQWHPELMSWPLILGLFSDPRINHCRRLITLHNVRRIVSTSHDYMHDAYLALRRADRVLVHTIYDLNLLKSVGLVENVTLFPHGVAVTNDDRPRPFERTITAPVIGTYGFVFRNKGLGLLIESLPALRELWPAARLRLVTAEYPEPDSGDEIRRCRELAERLELSESIEWITDFLPYEDSVRLLSTCDVVALPYLESPEAASGAARTALSSRRPVAVTPIRIFEDLADAVYRFRGLETADISAGLISLLGEPVTRQKTIEHASNWLSAHAWPVLSRRLVGMMLGILNDR